MAKTRAEIVADIEDHIEDRGGPFSKWYVGIAADARDRLFKDHSVKEEGDVWVYRRVASSAEARKIEKYFIDTKGTQGGPGGGDESSVFVYAYKIKSHTME